MNPARSWGLGPRCIGPSTTRKTTERSGGLVDSWVLVGGGFSGESWATWLPEYCLCKFDELNGGFRRRMWQC